jgi:hypothetical protein
MSYSDFLKYTKFIETQFCLNALGCSLKIVLSIDLRPNFSAPTPPEEEILVLPTNPGLSLRN